MNLMSWFFSFFLPDFWQNISQQAQEHLPFIYKTMSIFFDIFSITFIAFIICYLLSARPAFAYFDKIFSGIVKPAPSIMTAIGLFGTFYGLTVALKEFNLNDPSQISNFISELQPVFIYSILGIGSAVFFMMANFLINIANNIRAKAYQEIRVEEWEEQQENNRKSQNEVINALNNIKDISKNNLDKSNNQSKSLNESLNSIVKILKYQTKQQQDLFANMNTAISEMSIAIKQIETGNDIDRLSDILSQKVGIAVKDALAQPLEDIRQSLEKNNSEVIKGLLEDLKSEVLEPIKAEIKTTNSSVLAVTKAVNNSHETNNKLIEAVNKTTDTMNKVTDQTQSLVTEMGKTVDSMKTLQTEQKNMLSEFNDKLAISLSGIEPAIKRGMSNAESSLTTAIRETMKEMNGELQQTRDDIKGIIEGMKDTVDKITANTEQLVIDMRGIQDKQSNILDKFNADLSDNLAKIEPAITNSMRAAQTALTDAISLAMIEMNKTLNDTQTKMSEIIGKMSENVLTDLKGILSEFNKNMDTHLNRMNTELEETGTRAADLMSQTSDELKNSLGNIHETIENSSTILQEQLTAFKETYKESLTEFFEQQNKELEKTLGEQNRALQQTANELNQQFINMTDEQKKLHSTQQSINQDLQNIQHDTTQTYKPLLNEMTTIATTLNEGKSGYIKDIQTTNNEMEKINKALQTLGVDIISEFDKSFSHLNESYINQINLLNDNINTKIQELATALSVLANSLQNSNHNDD
ncbi:hypothetical protein [Psychrobacter sp. I-STPA10]|uniref:hypothetical protein n=1 Tax=Psychrobacter sp. I-STPA10 TaxID=2585769 RepID=UPI001E34D7B3|nr:hypothetical protein [Psychrobacter sp. I-STPA10]